ncbi:MAG TPA: hypothetical protein VLE97_08000 [Gaiellaceae bacterium]|nr:hypothetical protein [Gaiellaceae bacterium]
MRDRLLFATVGRAVYEYWEGATTGRWYWHRRVGSDITESGSYASRRSTRRKLHQVVDEERARRRRVRST